jgi:ABC-2 type transport system ATP-binding protein
MRQKVHVMGALIHDPSVWILDEPMLGLDPKGAYELKEMMREHAARGHSVLFSTHILETADALCDAVCIIAHGHKLFEGTLDDLKAAYPGKGLEQIFLEMTADE